MNGLIKVLLLSGLLWIHLFSIVCICPSVPNTSLYVHLFTKVPHHCVHVWSIFIKSFLIPYPVRIRGEIHILILVVQPTWFVLFLHLVL